MPWILWIQKRVSVCWHLCTPSLFIQCHLVCVIDTRVQSSHHTVVSASPLLKMWFTISHLHFVPNLRIWGFGEEKLRDNDCLLLLETEGGCFNPRLRAAVTHLMPSLFFSEAERFPGFTNLSLFIGIHSPDVHVAFCVCVCVRRSVRVYNIQYLQVLADVMEMMEGLCQSHKHRACIIRRLWLSKWEPVKTADRFMFLC